MKSLLIIAIALFSVAFAHTHMRTVSCNSDDDCQSPLTCRDNRCVFSRPFAPFYYHGHQGPTTFSVIVGKPNSVQRIPTDNSGHGRPHYYNNRDFDLQHRDVFPVCPPFCPAGSKCRGGICVQNSKWSDFFYKPCSVVCSNIGQICVRGVCV